MALTQFMNLPLEVIEKIMELVFVSDTPFYPQHAIELAGNLRELKEYDDAHSSGQQEPNVTCNPSMNCAKRWDLRKRANLNNKTSTALYTDKSTLITAAFPTQKRHLRDWILVNSTCSLLRAVGMRCFFSQKILFFDQNSFWAFHAGTSIGISREKQRLAILYARSVIVYLYPKGASMIRLPRIQRALPALRRFGIYSCNLGGPLATEGELSKITEWQSLPQELETRLRAIGLDMDSKEVGFLCQNIEDGRQQQIGLLIDMAYAALDTCAEYLQRVNAAKKQTGGATDT